MSRRKLRVALLLLVSLWAACAKHKAAPSRRLPVGDGVWFEEGIAENDSDTESTLLRAGISWVFYPACRVGIGEGIAADPVPAPAHPLTHLPVFLVVTGDETSAGVWRQGERSVTPLSNAIWLAIKDSVQNPARYGTIAGVHLDLPFSPAEAPLYQKVISKLRSNLPSTMLISISLRSVPTAQQMETFQPLLDGCDGLVAFMAGQGATIDPVVTDALEKTWWAGFAPGSRGVWTSAKGEVRGALPERVLARLVDDTRVMFLTNLALQETVDSSFSLVPREPVSIPGFSFQTGDKLVFRQPIFADIVYHLGADVTARRFARGRVLVLPGRSESERIFTLGALADVLTGKPTLVALRVAVAEERGNIRLEVQNTTPHASMISSTANWVEVEVPSAGIREVQTGGFNRFEVYGADRNPVTLGRATIVRFFENLVNPNETIEPAHILLRGTPPRDCCVYHFHVLSASGKEVTAETQMASAGAEAVAPTPMPGK